MVSIWVLWNEDIYDGVGFPKPRTQRVQVPNNLVLGFWVIVVIVLDLGKYMIIRYLDLQGNAKEAQHLVSTHKLRALLQQHRGPPHGYLGTSAFFIGLKLRNDTWALTLKMIKIQKQCSETGVLC